MYRAGIMAIITAITGTMVTTLVVMRIVTGIAGKENKPDGDSLRRAPPFR